MAEKIVSDLIAREIASGFRSLEGLHITGSIPVRQGLANELIAEFLKPSPQSEPTPANAPSKMDGESGISLEALKPMVKDLKITFVEGAALVEFDIRR